MDWSISPHPLCVYKNHYYFLIINLDLLYELYLEIYQWNFVLEERNFIYFYYYYYTKVLKYFVLQQKEVLAHGVLQFMSFSAFLHNVTFFQVLIIDHDLANEFFYCGTSWWYFLSPLVLLQKILTMIPSEEETQKIQEAQLANPDTPLGSAEQFLLILSSISELSARLQLWAFKMDYDALEKVSWSSLVSLNRMF